jgi:hypothetical protein
MSKIRGYDGPANSITAKMSTTGQSWVLDSGATDHMTPYKEKFKVLHPATGHVKVAGGGRLQIKGIGDIDVKWKESELQEGCVIKRVLYIPSLDVNLLSIPRIIEKNLGIKLSKENAIVMNQNNQIMVGGDLVDRTCIFHEAHTATVGTKQINSSAYILHKPTLITWHRRLGHLNMNAVKQVIKKQKIKIFPHSTTRELCDVCCSGKIKAEPFPTSTNKAITVLRLVHSDVVGPIHPVSAGENRYFITFTGDYTRYAEIFPMHTKDEALAKLKIFKERAENLANRKICSEQTTEAIM